MRRAATFTARLAAPLIAAALLVSAGCGNRDRTLIEGKLVHKDGTPLSGARVVLRSKQSGKTVHGTTDDSGHVELEVPVEEPRAAADDYDVMIVENVGEPDRPQAATIATKYQDGAKSGLKVTVQAGQRNQFDLTLDPP